MLNSLLVASGFLVERKHLQTHPLSVLSDSRLGIDASYYLGILTENPPSREPLLAATGGLPLALTQRIESDLRILEKLRIKPVFVFPGLLPNRRWKQQQQHQQEQNEACRDRREAWAKYEAGQEEAATKLFESRNNLQQWDLWKMVLRIFRHRNVEFMVAPYVSWAQVRLSSDVSSACIIQCKLTAPSWTVDLPSATFKIVYQCHFWTNGHASVSRDRPSDYYIGSHLSESNILIRHEAVNY